MEKKRERVKRIMYYSTKEPKPTVLSPDPIEWNGKLIQPPEVLIIDESVGDFVVNGLRKHALEKANSKTS